MVCQTVFSRMLILLEYSPFRKNLLNVMGALLIGMLLIVSLFQTTINTAVIWDTPWQYIAGPLMAMVMVMGVGGKLQGIWK